MMILRSVLIETPELRNKKWYTGPESSVRGPAGVVDSELGTSLSFIALKLPVVAYLFFKPNLVVQKEKP